MAFTQPHTKATPSINFTPSPPSRPTTPGSQKPAYIAAHTPTPSRIRTLNNSSTPARQACGLLHLSLSSASKSTKKKRERSSLGNVESVSPTQAAVKRWKRPRISREGLMKLKMEDREGGGSFAIEIAAGEAASPVKLDNQDIGVLENIAQSIEDTKEAIKETRKAMTPAIEPCTPPPRRRGRPPKKPTLQDEASKSISPGEQISPALAISPRKKQAVGYKLHKQATGTNPQAAVEHHLVPKLPPATKSPEYSRSRLQELMNKLDNDPENTSTKANEISDALADIIEGSSMNELAASMVHLKAPDKVRHKIFLCIIVALLSKGAAERGSNTIH
ncbi:uncharacterized protein DFL_003444 [Arthrobotrys flagrans]|uniref:Uncharacterized protein n=1 Tax=Arthrobotrys flagrans TaxID=97331 RepID=A0A437A1U1_ARTFL|nr:hypothetical protein DFL_003444 [Arthrobotrys flagrans]